MGIFCFPIQSWFVVCVTPPSAAPVLTSNSTILTSECRIRFCTNLTLNRLPHPIPYSSS